MTGPALLTAALLPWTIWVTPTIWWGAANRAISARAKMSSKLLIMLVAWVISFVILPGFRFDPAAAETLFGLPYITDADTITISGTRIRLAGIDAPEMGQVCLDAHGRDWRCGVAAREALTAASAGTMWRCELQAKPDRYGRRVGACVVGGAGIEAWLVRSGWALDWPRYSHGLYTSDQDAARVARRGVWSGAFVAPWDWRHHACATAVLGARAVPAEAARRLCQQ